MLKPAGAARGAPREVAPFQEQRREARRSEVVGGARSGDPASDNEHVVDWSRHAKLPSSEKKYHMELFMRKGAYRERHGGAGKAARLASRCRRR